MVGSGAREVPPPLASYFDKVLEQARRLAKEPTAAQSGILPEAVQLALDIRDVSAFREAIDDVQSIKTMKPEQAQKALASLERFVAA